MKYFLPDSQDLVDPSFDFATERRARSRLRHRDDLYAHELFDEPMLDGFLVSKGIVDGFGATGSRYTLAQRHRLLRLGAREFFRTDAVPWGPIPIMGDCGAFTYVKEKEPPYKVEDVASFYVDCGFELGISVDHVILAYDPRWDSVGAPKDMVERQELTLALARDFLELNQRHKLRFTPLGVAQGWSPASYADALRQLQSMGYQYIAVGGMVPLKTPEIIASLRAMNEVRRKNTKLHLLGVTRTESLGVFASLGVASFDSTSPLRQAFKDDKDNYYTMDRQYTAIRVPQVQGNARFQKRILAGEVSHDDARRLERECLNAMAAFNADEISVERVLDKLLAYEALYDPKANHVEAYRETLMDRPWKQCSCEVCTSLGHHVILFRGAERNRRRGLHNTWVFYRRLQREMGLSAAKEKTRRKAAQ